MAAFDDDLDFERMLFEHPHRSASLSHESLCAAARISSAESLYAAAEAAFPPPGWESEVKEPVVVESVERDEEGNFSIDFSSPQAPQLRVHLHDFEVLRLVGAGTYGRVYQVALKATGMLFAMKVLRKELLAETKSVAATRTERDILRKVRHPFFVSLHFAFQDAGRVYLVMDWIAGGPLFQRLRLECMIAEDQARLYLAQLVLALEHLHGQSIIHRDLKPENILLTPRGNIAITDFGFAKEDMGDQQRTTTFCGTIEYMAPEMIKGEQYGKAADWWSVGVLMYDMLTGSPPFTSENQATLQQKICTQKIKFPGYLTSGAVSLLRGFLEREPSKRLGPDIRKIRMHPFFKGFSWKNCIELKISPPFVPKLASLSDVSNFEAQYTNISTISHSPSVNSPPALSSSQELCFQGFSYVRSPDVTSPLRE
ncbi:MAG: AGC family serine/threonine-protein kinase [archaeon]|nr:AGC family serine/threonine-protein kinase [archaeon]